MLSFVSAGVSLVSDPLNLYNLNDKIELTVSITPDPTIDDLFVMKLVCSDVETEIYKEYLVLEESVEKRIVVPLVTEFIGDSLGSCSITSKVGDEKRTLSTSFTISNDLVLTLNDTDSVFEPGRIVALRGQVFRENNDPSNGVVEAVIDGGKASANVTVSADISDGLFTLNVPLPDNFYAGPHKISLRAYEKNQFHQITNEGDLESYITIAEVPTNLEIIVKDKEIVPGTNLIAKVVLRDQTGEKIRAPVFVAIKNEVGEIIEKIETDTDETFMYYVDLIQSPDLWEISVLSEDLIAHANFEILENKEVAINLVNKTLTIQNIGNVRFTDTVGVDVGDDRVPVDVDLGVGELQKYNVYAPNGEYIIAFDGGEGVAALTGNAVKIEEAARSNLSGFKVFVWTFVLLILILVTYVFFRKGDKRTFLGKPSAKKAREPIKLKEMPAPQKLIAASATSVQGHLSTSITGSRQNAPVGCIFIKNYEEVKDGAGGVNETLAKISSAVDASKGILYENRGNIFFLLAPIRTKTFDNEVPIIRLAEKIIAILNEHNRMFKKKIVFGIGINYGAIVTKEEAGSFKFMSMGTLLTLAKKIANKSDGKILLNEAFRTRLGSNVKVERVDIPGMHAFSLKSIVQKQDNSKFISNFLDKNFKNKK